MSVRPDLPCPPPSAALSGRDGELILLRISVAPRLLERLLEALAETSYHINPHVLLPDSDGRSAIEFPAYEGWVQPITKALRRAGFDSASVEARGMLAAIGN